MALLQNGYRDFSSGLKIIGATASNSGYPYSAPANWNKTSTRRNLTAGEGITSKLAGIPNGYRNEYAWSHPWKAGALASRNEINGAGALAASGAMGVNAEASSSGSGSLTGTGQLVVSASATISGSGSLTGTVNAALAAGATLAGTGSITGTMQALGWITTAMSGTGSVTATATAAGALAALIDVAAATELTASGIASEILDEQLVETGLTVRETLRLCVAAMAGKVSGAAGSTITIRSAVADDADRIVATVDSNGNRSAITYDLG